MKSLPNHVQPYNRTPVFTQETVPAGLLKNHNTKENVWAVIHVIKGKLQYNIENGESIVLQPGIQGVIEPQILHNVSPLGEVEFFVEFYK